MLASASVLAIRGYQRWLSPRKGYSCAFRVLNGGTGCSGYAKAALTEHGFRAALPLIRQRFRDCAAAARELRARCRCQTAVETASLDPQAPDAASPQAPGTRKRNGGKDCGTRCLDMVNCDRICAPQAFRPERVKAPPPEKEPLAIQCRNALGDGILQTGFDCCFSGVFSACKGPMAKVGLKAGSCCDGCDCGGP